MIGQTANILLYLARVMGWRRRRKDGCGASAAARSRIWCWKFDTHHPLGPSLYYEDQRAPANNRTAEFWQHRVPKFAGYFEQLLADSGGAWITGRRLCYVDLSLFQIVDGLRYAFPRRMKAFERKIPGLVELHDRVAARPNIKAYLKSERRIPFNEDGIFRRYRELDG